MDEATPGNTLNPANSRKYCAVYFSWVEMGRWRLTCTHAWLPAAFIRTDEIRNVEGGTGAVMKALLRIMFVEEHALTRGVDLPLPSGSRRIYFTSHAFLADADAHKATFDYFGMPTPTFPKRHWNKLHSHATPPSIVFVARHARVIILACTRAFHARSQLGQKSCLPSWGLWLCLVAGGLLGCSGVGVLPHDFSGGGGEGVHRKHHAHATSRRDKRKRLQGTTDAAPFLCFLRSRTPPLPREPSNYDPVKFGQTSCKSFAGGGKPTQQGLREYATAGYAGMSSIPSVWTPSMQTFGPEPS